MATCYLHHKISPRCPNSQPIHTTPPHNSPIAYRPLSIPSVEVSKHQRTTCKSIYSLLSTPYSVSTNDSNNKQPMYILRNSEVRSSKHFYSGDAVIISVAIVIHLSIHTRHIAICALPLSTIYFNFIS